MCSSCCHWKSDCSDKNPSSSRKCKWRRRIKREFSFFNFLYFLFTAYRCPSLLSKNLWNLDYEGHVLFLISRGPYLWDAKFDNSHSLKALVIVGPLPRNKLMNDKDICLSKALWLMLWKHNISSVEVLSSGPSAVLMEVQLLSLLAWQKYFLWWHSN